MAAWVENDDGTQLRSKVSRHNERVIFGKDVAIAIDPMSPLPISCRKVVAVGFIQIAVAGLKTSVVVLVMPRGTPVITCDEDIKLLIDSTFKISLSS